MAYGLSFILAPWIHALVGFYAPYESWKAIISEDDSAKQWLTFWSIYMIINIIEDLALKTIIRCLTFGGQTWFYEIKALTLIYLMYFDGASQFYTKFIEPWMKEHQADMDAAVARVTSLSAESRALGVKNKNAFIELHGKTTHDVLMKQIRLIGRA